MALQKRVVRYLFDRFPSHDTEKARRALDGAAPATDEERQRWRRRHAEQAYAEEKALNSFAWVPADALRGKHVLDLGCDVGGRSTAWSEIFGFGGLYGVETTPAATAAAHAFAAAKGIVADFRVGRAEELPFEDATLDAIVSNDVLEHVRSPERTLEECARVLKPGGLAVLRFPPRLHPFESHLGHVANPFVPFHWFFSAGAIREAYCEAVVERGVFPTCSCESWEWLPTLNGISVRTFRRLVRTQGWEIVHWEPFSYPRRRWPAVRAVLRRLAVLPVAEEILLNRISVILRRPEDVPSAMEAAR